MYNVLYTFYTLCIHVTYNVESINWKTVWKENKYVGASRFYIFSYSNEVNWYIYIFFPNVVKDPILSSRVYARAPIKKLL